MTPPKIVALREGDLPAAAAALSRAFQDDPLQNMCCRILWNAPHMMP
jgi:hypothetical protein